MAGLVLVLECCLTGSHMDCNNLEITVHTDGTGCPMCSWDAIIDFYNAVELLQWLSPAASQRMRYDTVLCDK